MTTKNLLVELFVEELPPKALEKLGQGFGSGLHWALNRFGLAGDDLSLNQNIKFFASPRRLAVWIKDVPSRAPDKPVSIKLMPVAVGLTANGEPTPALLKKLAAVGADASAVPQLKRQLDGKAEALYFDSIVTGATLAEGLQKALDEALADLPIPKLMQYQLADGWTSVNFVRPAHGLVALHGADVVPVRALGLSAGRATHGHRFEARVDPIALAHADDYAQRLEADGAVIASFADRRAEIVRQIAVAAAREGLTPIDEADLLDEVTALVERPNVLLCRFEPEFLSVPPECLILTMKANQKYFPLRDAAGELTHKFLVVSNITPADASRVIEGNERVVRPRLADAKFFFDQDRKHTLASRVAGLDKVVYHGKLGTQGERVARVRAIARAIGQRVGGDVLAAQADRAALLAKADLLTDMVGEFPELQGIMGGYYAVHDGETGEIAQAVEDHYKPRFAGDALPRNLTGVVVALADKLETLVGMFGIGQHPTGDKDPFALRRHALGVLRLVVENSLAIDLSALLGLAQDVGRSWSRERVLAQATQDTLAVQGGLSAPWEEMPPLDDAIAQLASFIFERLAVMSRDQGYSPQEVEAVLSLRPQRLADVPKLLEAVRAFTELPEATLLAGANKRIANMLKKSMDPVVDRVNTDLFQEPREEKLWEVLQTTRQSADAFFERSEYTESLRVLAALGPSVDAFFEGVMVNAKADDVRANRLALLAQLHAAMNRVADLSKLAS